MLGEVSVGNYDERLVSLWYALWGQKEWEENFLNLVCEESEVDGVCLSTYTL